MRAVLCDRALLTYIVNNTTFSDRVYALRRKTLTASRFYESLQQFQVSRCPIDILSSYPAMREYLRARLQSDLKDLRTSEIQAVRL